VRGKRNRIEEEEQSKGRERVDRKANEAGARRRMRKEVDGGRRVAKGGIRMSEGASRVGKREGGVVNRER